MRIFQSVLVLLSVLLIGLNGEPSKDTSSIIEKMTSAESKSGRQG